LPVSRVVRDVPVHEKVEEMPGAEAPVHFQILDQERRDDEAGASGDRGADTKIFRKPSK